VDSVTQNRVKRNDVAMGSLDPHRKNTEKSLADVFRNLDLDATGPLDLTAPVQVPAAPNQIRCGSSTTHANQPEGVGTLDSSTGTVGAPPVTSDMGTPLADLNLVGSYSTASFSVSSIGVVGAAEPPVANNDAVFAVTENTALVIAASSLLSNDTDPNGLALSISAVSNPTGGAVTFDTATATVTFTPTADYVGAASFNYTITDSTGLTSTANVGLYVGLPIVDSLWTNSATPSALSTNDPNPVELGMRFVASTDGVITGLRYYKSALDTGTHVGSLWTSTGTLLASATFANETDSGWQTVNFASGVSIVAGTPYVAAYHSNGNYAASVGYFTSDYTNGPLTAPGGTNGVYTYSNTSVFPTSTYNGNNYWVDVLDRPSMLSPPVVPNASGFTTYENTAVIIAASTLLALDSDPNNLALSVSSVSSPTNGTVAFNSATGAITFTPTASYTGSAGFSYTVSDTAGLTTSASVALTVNAPAPPVVNADSGFIATENQALSIAASGLLANDTDPNGLALSLSGVSNPSNGTVSFNAATNMVIFTPTTDYVGPASFTYTVADIAGATASGAVSLTVSPPAGAAAITQLYENILGRSPDSGGLAFYTSLYNGGAGVGLAQIAQILAESSESVTRLSTLTLDVTGVAITDTQLASYQAQLASGTTLATVATPLVTQAQGEIDALYRQILNRGADSSGLAGYSSMVPNMAIQDATPIADIRSILAYSAEDTANLTSLFNLVYATNPSTAQLLGYETQLAAGTPFSNLQIVSDLRTQINGLYQQVLGRGADDTGMSTYTNQVIGGSSLHDVQVALADSPETQNNLERLYLDVLGRTIDPSGQVAYRGALENGTALKQVRLWLASSEESAGYISAAYSVGYGSAPSANVLTFIENQLAAVKGTGATGTTLSAITSSLAAPLVIDMAGNQGIDTHSTDQIFAAVTVTDPTTGPETATITLNDATGATDANGTLAGLSLTHVSAGIYTVTAGSAAALTSALDNLLFTPTTDSLTTVSVSVKNASDNLVGTGSTTITSSSLGLSGTPSFIYSSVGNDTFNGTALAGSAAPGNIFAFTATTDLGSTGNDIIANFSLSHDQLQLNIGRFANVAAVLAATNDSGTNAVITLDAASSITLVGVHKTDLSSTNFILRHTS
jgi:hypothetical protein